jgi:hypothetical protein
VIVVALQAGPHTVPSVDPERCSLASVEPT